ncbi:MAG: M15 family metallopeptidase [Pseudomonadales bacterium]|nr:M15 family metallopeptidase [Pseudomonadales bacterium]
MTQLRQIHQDLGIPASYLEQPPLPLCREPEVLVDTSPDFYQRPQKLIPAAHQGWLEMRAAAAREDVVLHLISAFRGIAYQRDLIHKHLQNGRPLVEILQVVAAPGFSEHHTGRAIDLGTDNCRPLQEEFEKTDAFQWLVERAGEFGFAMTYPRDNPFGISYEPWHWCFRDQQ